MSKKVTGTEFEALTKLFFSDLFTEMGYNVLHVRRQDSGTQDGFDISIDFYANDIEYKFYFECKYYEQSSLRAESLIIKIIQLVSSFQDDIGAFIGLSPKVNITNIEERIRKNILMPDDFSNTQILNLNFPISLWTPDYNVDEIFSINPTLYNKIYPKQPFNKNISRDQILENTKSKIDLLISQKELLRAKSSRLINIDECNRKPMEHESYKTTLDNKLDSILKQDDNYRDVLHDIRADYKVYLENLQDVNPTLRNDILKWQDEMRLKAHRLTKQFQIDESYTSKKFFIDFFKSAEDSLNVFYNDCELKGDREKLLQGVVMELAAECPLNWEKERNE